MKGIPQAGVDEIGLNPTAEATVQPRPKKRPSKTKRWGGQAHARDEERRGILSTASNNAVGPEV